jgi:hypothetical protein
VSWACTQCRWHCRWEQGGASWVKGFILKVAGLGFRAICIWPVPLRQREHSSRPYSNALHEILE